MTLRDAYLDSPDQEWRLRFATVDGQIPFYESLRREDVRDDAAWDALIKFTPEDAELYYAIYRQGIRRVPALDNMPLAHTLDGEFLPLVRVLNLLREYQQNLLAVLQQTAQKTEQLLQAAPAYVQGCLTDPPGPDAVSDLSLLGEHVATLARAYCGLATQPPIPDVAQRLQNALRDLEGHMEVAS